RGLQPRHQPIPPEHRRLRGPRRLSLGRERPRSPRGNPTRQRCGGTTIGRSPGRVDGTGLATPARTNASITAEDALAPPVRSTDTALIEIFPDPYSAESDPGSGAPH